MGWRGPAAIRSSRSLLGERGRGEAATYGPAAESRARERNVAMGTGRRGRV